MRASPRLIGFGILFFCGGLYLWGLGELPFYTKGEPREATVVWEIHTSGEWILPLRNGHIIPSKPPLFHWLGTLAALACGGLSEFTIRLPSAVLAIAGVLLTYVTGLSLWGVEAGLVAALVLATSFEWVRAATTARVDMTLTVCMVAAFLSFQHLYRQRTVSRGQSLVFFLLLGLATLAKGPVGAVLPALTVVVFLALRRDLAFLRELPVVSGSVVLVAVAGSWYGLALWRGGYDFFATQIMKENVLRFVSTNAAGAGHKHPVYYFLPSLFLGMAPWSFFLPAVAVFVYQGRGALQERGLLYPVVWAATVFLFYSVASGKRTVYILPMYPAAALLIGAWWQDLRRGEVQLPGALSWLLRGGGYLCSMVMLLAVAIVVGQFLGGDLIGRIRPWLHPKDQRTLPLFAQVVSQHGLAFLLWSAVLVPSALALLLAVRRQQWGRLFVALLAFTASTFLLVRNVVQPIIATARTFRPFMERVTQRVGPAPLFLYRAYDDGAVYYAARHIPAFDPARVPAGHAVYLLMWENDWRDLAALGEGVSVVETSEGTGPRGQERLVLVQVAPGTPVPAFAGNLEEESGSDDDDAS